jgi:hypothetical protein
MARNNESRAANLWRSPYSNPIPSELDKTLLQTKYRSLIEYVSVD